MIFGVLVVKNIKLMILLVVKQPEAEVASPVFNRATDVFDINTWFSSFIQRN